MSQPPAPESALPQNRCAHLRQVSPAPSPGMPSLDRTFERWLDIGRDPQCRLALDPAIYGSVSRRHAEIRYNPEGDGQWQICDLDSANGTFVNGQRIAGCHPLQHGDRLRLSHSGPEFRFECLPAAALPYAETPVGVLPSGLTLTQLFPLASTGRDLLHKAYLLPGLVTVAFVVILFASLGQPRAFNMALSVYLAGAAYYFVYRLCDKAKPLWELVGAALLTVAMLRSPVLTGFIYVFRELLPGYLPPEGAGFVALLVSSFFGAGLMEELLKALPVALAAAIGRFGRSGRRDRAGVREPLDGILLGTAAAAGFTIAETMGFYVPHIIQSVAAQVGPEIGELTGLQLLIPRILGSVAGHMAYSGYFGYFIGLSILKPHQRWPILTIGYLSASLLHAFWNASASVSPWLLALVGGVSYAFLAAAILKARALSPRFPASRT